LTSREGVERREGQPGEEGPADADAIAVGHVGDEALEVNECWTAGTGQRAPVRRVAMVKCQPFDISMNRMKITFSKILFQIPRR